MPEPLDGNGTQYEIYCDCGQANRCVQISDLLSIEQRNEPDAFTDIRYKEEYIELDKQFTIKQWNTRFI